MYHTEVLIPLYVAFVSTSAARRRWYVHISEALALAACLFFSFLFFLVGGTEQLYRDPAAGAVVEAALMPWNGRRDVLIDRFDARAVLDMVPLSPKVLYCGCRCFCYRSCCCWCWVSEWCGIMCRSSI